MKNFEIRQGTREDLDEAYQLIKAASETVKMKDGDEQDFTIKLREGKNFIPELSMIAETDRELTGHIMVIQTPVLQSNDEQYTALLIAPLSVQSEYRDLEVGSALVREGLKLTTEMGYQTIFLTDDPSYYSWSRYQSSNRLGITCPGISDRYVLIYELVPHALDKVEGTIGEW